MDFKAYSSIPRKQQVALYKSIIKPRMIEEKMLKLLRQGQVSKWFSGIGQEAIAVGVTQALRNTDYVFPMHRNLGVFTTRGITFEKLLNQWQGNFNGFTKGRDRSFHFGTKEYNIIGMISHLAAMLSVADGVGLASLLEQDDQIAVAFCGEGATSEGEFHEAINLAAVWNLPVLFVVENNGYGLSTPSSDQFKCENIADKGIGYGIDSQIVDGNNVLEVYSEVASIARKIRRKPRPFLLECKTFRMRGHEEASGTKYVPKELMEFWAEKDPVQNYESYLKSKRFLTDYKISKHKVAVEEEIEQGLKVFKSKQKIEVDTNYELNDVYMNADVPLIKSSDEKEEIRFIDAVSEGLRGAMREHSNLVLMGQDIAEYGGVFKITEGFIEEFGLERVRNTPISEAAPLGAALGLSIKGYKSMVEMQFADFVSCGFNQIVNNLAKTHYRWQQNADVVIRMPTGAGSGAGPFHSQSNEAWFFHVPGLKIVYPSTPEDAKGLLLSSFYDPNPVLFFEHKNLYRAIKGNVPTNNFTIPIGKAKWVKKGDDVTIITYGLGVHWCSNYVAENNIDATILDLRSLVPWDKEAVVEAVERTGKVVVVHEDNLQGGIGAEIAAWIGEHCFKLLDAPVMRVASINTPIPFNKDLEDNYLGLNELGEKLNELLNW